MFIRDNTLNKLHFQFVKWVYYKIFQNLHTYNAILPTRPEISALQPTIIFSDDR